MATSAIQRRLRKLEGAFRPDDIVIVIEYVEMPPIADRLQCQSPIVVCEVPAAASKGVVVSEV